MFTQRVAHLQLALSNLGISVLQVLSSLTKPCSGDEEEIKSFFGRASTCLSVVRNWSDCECALLENERLANYKEAIGIIVADKKLALLLSRLLHLELPLQT